MLPGGRAGFRRERTDTQRFLRRRHDARFRRIDVGRKGLTEAVAVDPEKAVIIGPHLGGAGGGGPLLAERFAALALLPAQSGEFYPGDDRGGAACRPLDHPPPTGRGGEAEG